MSDLLHQLENRLVATIGAIEELGLTLPNEPLEIPVRKLPVVTLKWVGVAAVDYETGGGQDVTHSWRIYVYAKARTLEDGWEDMKLLGVKIARALRDDPTVGDLAAFTKFRTESEPDIVKRGSQTLGQMSFLFDATGVDEF